MNGIAVWIVVIAQVLSPISIIFIILSILGLIEKITDKSNGGKNKHK